MNIVQQVSYWFFELLIWCVIIRVLLNWFGNPNNAFTNLIYSIADPILNSFRRFNLQIGMIDITPIVVIIFLNFVSYLVNSLISSISI